MSFQILSTLVIVLCSTVGDSGIAEATTHEATFHIDGKVMLGAGVGSDVRENWIQDARIVVDDGQYIGFPKRDGRFRVSNLQSGSYVLQVSHPKYSFEPIRVDISSAGKRRARRLNRVQPGEVHLLPYPVRFIARQSAAYFQRRNTWTMAEVLSNPTTMMLILPMLVLLLLLKLQLPQLLDAVNKGDDHTTEHFAHSQKERGGVHQPWLAVPWNDLPIPDLSELVMRWLGDWPEDADKLKSGKKARRRRQKNAQINPGAPPHPETLNGRQYSLPSAVDNSFKSSAPRRKNRKKKK